MIDVAVLATGIANTASVLAALRRAGAKPRLSEDPSDVSSDRTAVVLPGVGAFGAGMARLHELGLAEPLKRRIAAKKPTLAVCLGLQLLAETSAETEGAAGLGIIPGKIERLPSDVRVPQLGWNHVEPSSGCRLLAAGNAYFANSYCLYAVPEGFQPAFTTYSRCFTAAFESGAVLACQFHPELSGKWGHELISRWLARSREDLQC